MNGNGRWAELLSGGLGCLVRRRDLSLLTMAAFTDVLAAPRVLADKKRWCAACYASMRERPAKRPLRPSRTASTASARPLRVHAGQGTEERIGSSSYTVSPRGAGPCRY